MESQKKGRDFTGICVCYFCYDDQGNFLIHRRSQNTRDEQGRWDTGGGSLEYGHTAEQTLRKEIREEYGTEVLDFQFLGYRDVLRKNGSERSHWLALDFKARVDPALVKNGEPHMIEELRWVTFETLPEPLHSQLPTFFEKYRTKLEAL